MKTIKTKKLDEIISKIAFAFLRVLWLKSDKEMNEMQVIVRRTFQLTMTIPALIFDITMIFFFFVIVKLVYLFLAYLLMGFYEISTKFLIKFLAWFIPLFLIAITIFIYQEGKWSDITDLFTEIWNFLF